jgi:hypothetical protein
MPRDNQNNASSSTDRPETKSANARHAIESLLMTFNNSFRGSIAAKIRGRITNEENKDFSYHMDGLRQTLSGQLKTKTIKEILNQLKKNNGINDYLIPLKNEIDKLFNKYNELGLLNQAERINFKELPVAIGEPLSNSQLQNMEGANLPTAIATPVTPDVQTQSPTANPPAQHNEPSSSTNRNGLDSNSRKEDSNEQKRVSDSATINSSTGEGPSTSQQETNQATTDSLIGQESTQSTPDLPGNEGSSTGRTPSRIGQSPETDELTSATNKKLEKLKQKTTHNHQQTVSQLGKEVATIISSINLKAEKSLKDFKQYNRRNPSSSPSILSATEAGQGASDRER